MRMFDLRFFFIEMANAIKNDKYNYIYIENQINLFDRNIICD